MILIIKRELIYIWYYFEVLLGQIFWYWVTGMAIGSAVSVFAKDKIHGRFEKMNGSRLGALGVIPACLLGIASPLCMYGTIPVAASFANHGMRHDWLAAFMMASVLLNPQLIIYSAALGPAALAVRIVSCFLCGCTAGWLVMLFYRDKPFFDFSGFEEPTSRDTDPNLLLRYLKNFGRNIKATGPYFLVGVLLSVLFQLYVPKEYVTALFGGNRAWGVLMAATIGVPLYACGGGTIPILRAWMAQGMSLGSAAAFMITGPSTKITNLGALKIVMGMKKFLAYILFTVVFAFAAGMITNLVL